VKNQKIQEGKHHLEDMKNPVAQDQRVVNKKTPGIVSIIQALKNIKTEEEIKVTAEINKKKKEEIKVIAGINKKKEEDSHIKVVVGLNILTKKETTLQTNAILAEVHLIDLATALANRKKDMNTSETATVEVTIHHKVAMVENKEEDL